MHGELRGAELHPAQGGFSTQGLLSHGDFHWWLPQLRCILHMHFESTMNFQKTGIYMYAPHACVDGH